MNRELGVGLIGCGGIGQYLVERLVKVPRAKLVAVCDESEAVAEKVGQQYASRVCTNPDALLSAPEIEAVIVGTPQFAHKPLVLAAAAHKKHIYCEKPMALSVADCDEMLRAAEAAGVKFMVGQVLRLISTYARAKQLIETENLGHPKAISITRLGEGFTPAFNQGWRTKRDLTGGLLLEVHVHELDYMRHVCGDVESVFAQGTKVFQQDMGYEDLWHVLLKFRNGAIGVLRGGLSTLITEHHFAIQCAEGSITNDTPNRVLSFRKRGQNPVEIPQAELDKMEDGFQWELRSWVEAILDDKPMIVTARDGRQAVAIGEAAEESARTVKLVAVK